VLTQENLTANADGIADWLKITTGDRFMIVLPLHHINSTTMSLATLLRGGTIVLVNRYSNSKFFEIAAGTGATLASVVPTIVHDQLEQKSQFNILKSKLKLTRIQLGSAPVVAKEAEEFVKMTGIPLIQGYGQTETALRSTGVRLSRWRKFARSPSPTRYRSGWPQTAAVSLANLPTSIASQARNPASFWRDLRSNTIGSEMKWTNVTVLGKGGSQAPEGQEGEICVRGPVIMKKYLKNPAATEEAFKYGWFHSGDLGYWKMVDGEKQFFLKGRIKEIIIKTGVNVSPVAVEEKILESVAGVDQVYVVGVGDERAGEEIGAVVVWKKGSGGIREIGGIKGLADFETPKYWFSIPARRLPMTSTGKVQRVKLKEMFSGCAAIAETGDYMFRAVAAAEEEEVVEEAREMYNRYWRPLQADKKAWGDQLRDKVMIGAFEKKTGKLDGWIRIRAEGKTVLADAVTARGNKNYKSYKNYNGEDKGVYRNLKDFKGNIEEINKYLNLRLDPVIEWHRKPKAGWNRGAKVIKIIENARPGDTPALGYGVLMEYPEFAGMPAPEVTAGASLGMQLVEAGLVYAKKAGFDKVRVLSRPVGLLSWVIQNTRKTRRTRLSDSRRIGGSED
jgi:hypothetical protein